MTNTKITNREFGENIGVSHSMASRIRSGDRLPGVRTLTLLAKALDTDPGHVLDLYAQGPAAFGDWVRKRELELANKEDEVDA